MGRGVQRDEASLCWTPTAHVVALFVFAIIKPDGLEAVSVLRPIALLCTVGQLVAFCFAVALYARQTISPPFALIMLVGGACYIPSLLKGDVGALFSSNSFTFLKIVTVCMFAEVYLERGRLEILLSGIFEACAAILVMNLFVTYVWNPGGMYTSSEADEIASNVFVGQKNTLRNPLFLGLLSRLLMDLRSRGTMSAVLWAFMGLSVASILFAQSATSTVTFLFTISLVLLVVFASVRLPVRALYIGVAALFFLFAVVRRIGFVQSFITEVLGRDMTLSGRTFIWDSAFDMIADHPLLGNGIQISIVWSNEYNDYLTVSHAHGAYIDIAARAGLLGTVLFLALMIFALVALEAKPQSLTQSVLASILVGFLFSGVFGELWGMPFYLTVLLACRAADIRRWVEEPAGDQLQSEGGRTARALAGPRDTRPSRMHIDTETMKGAAS